MKRINFDRKIWEGFTNGGDIGPLSLREKTMWVFRGRTLQKDVQRSWGGNVLEPSSVHVRNSTGARCMISVRVREDEVREGAWGQALLNLMGHVKD